MKNPITPSEIDLSTIYREVKSFKSYVCVCVCGWVGVFDRIECLSANTNQHHLTAVCVWALNTVRANKGVAGQ